MSNWGPTSWIASIRIVSLVNLSSGWRNSDIKSRSSPGRRPRDRDFHGSVTVGSRPSRPVRRPRRAARSAAVAAGGDVPEEDRRVAQAPRGQGPAIGGERQAVYGGDVAPQPVPLPPRGD